MSVARRSLIPVALLAFAVLAACPSRPPSLPLPDDDDGGVADVDAGEPDAGPRPEECDFDPPTVCPAPAPTYGDVEPIFQARCQLCHSPEGEEWPLVTYSHVVDWAPDIHDLVLNCSMPPPDAGVPITTDERIAILEWLLCGHPE